MEYRDFNPKQIISLNSNLVSITMNMINSHSQNWLTQASYVLMDNCSWALNSYYHQISSTTTDDIRSSLAQKEADLKKFCNIIIGYISRPYDVQYSYQVEKERVITEEIPKERKVGLFKKETYMEKVSRTQKYTATETFAYKGWLVERFYRTEGNGSSADTVYFDYCLGADGNMYMITYLKENPAKQQVYACSYFSQGLLNEQYCNVYNAVLGGALGALDAVTENANDQSRSVHLYLDDDYYYNFPVQIEDDQYSFNFFAGTYYRVIMLLSGEEMQKCFADHEWIKKKFLG